MARSERPLVAGNWKMNGLAACLADIEAIADGVARRAAGAALCVICPPATLLHRASAHACSGLELGGQDCATQPSGPHTGDLSAEMLGDAGARWVILGHSERRHDHHETSALVRAKAEAALAAGLKTIICVGELRDERNAGRAREVVGAQIDDSVPRTTTADTLVVAYEPVWAIGTGTIPTGQDVADMHGFIRQRLHALLPQHAEGVRLLYGGSVKPDNAAELMDIKHVDGALVGGASLKAEEFLAIAGVYR